jgi:FlaA1/EpsC-like NDP-sugar epimerase
MEANPEEAILNNVGGTRNLVDAALAIGTQTFVNISTDKAVNPTSVMGASKRVAELVVLDASLKCSAHQTFCSVRFGNVLGSRGSVVPLFREQIQRGGPITVTHPEMRRYFMTIPEAARLVLQAGGLQDNGRVYVLNMGQPVRIVDLARDMIHFSGLEPETDIEIKFTGVRPGEKLYEELLTAEEGTKATCVESIYTARAMAPADSFTYLLNRLIRAAEEQQQEAVRARLGEIVESFRPPTKLEAATSTAERMFV